MKFTHCAKNKNQVRRYEINFTWIQFKTDSSLGFAAANSLKLKREQWPKTEPSKIDVKSVRSKKLWISKIRLRGRRRVLRLITCI